MRSLEDITDAVRRNEPATEDELRLAICAYDVLLAQLQLDKNPVLLAEFFKAGEADPLTYIGPANDPRNPEAVAWHRAFKMDVKPWNCSGCGVEILVQSGYEPEGCCSGAECGCMGRETNPVFCTDCENKLFGRGGEDAN